MSETELPPEGRTDVTKDEVDDLLRELHPDRVFSVEEDVVWVSGMNARCKRVAENLAKTLRMHGIPTGLVHDDEIHAVDNGGVQFCYGSSA